MVFGFVFPFFLEFDVFLIIPHIFFCNLVPSWFWVILLFFSQILCIPPPKDAHLLHILRTFFKARLAPPPFYVGRPS